MHLHTESEIVLKSVKTDSRGSFSTCTEVLIDETFDFLKLLEIRGLQEREQVTHVELFPGHGGRGNIGVWLRWRGGAFRCHSLCLLSGSLGRPLTQSPGTTGDARARAHTKTPLLNFGLPNTTPGISSPTTGRNISFL